MRTQALEQSRLERRSSLVHCLPGTVRPGSFYTNSKTDDPVETLAARPSSQPPGAISATSGATGASGKQPRVTGGDRCALCVGGGGGGQGDGGGTLPAPSSQSPKFDREEAGEGGLAMLPVGLVPSA